VLDVPVNIEDKPDAFPLTAIWMARWSSRMSPSATARGCRCSSNVSFRVNPGETVAIVGPTGSGKSSCMSLVHRFYDVWDGSVTVGGYDVRDVTQDSLGEQVAMVLQEPFLFTGTVIENIRYNKESATREQVDRCGEGGRRA
jgi:ATP-binding cassette subfamily B multidrug efflux pump